MYPLLITGAVLLFFYFRNRVGSGDISVDAQVQRIREYYYQDAADASSIYTGIPYKLILAIIAVESGGAPEAVGSIGERGLMQITRDALADYNSRWNPAGTRASWDDLLDERVNVFVGTGYLKLLYERTADIDRAIRAYNVGLRNVTSPTSTAGSDYLSKVKYYEGLF